MPDESQELANHLHIQCFSCKQNEASHAYRFDWDGLSFQLCLCSECVSLGKNYLIGELLYEQA